MTAKLYFTKEHEWLLVEGDQARVGITAYAQDQLGDVVYVELPALGKEVEKGGEAAVVESVKAASEVYAPVSGTVTAINGNLEGEPQLVNSDPLGAGWFFELSLQDAGQLSTLLDQAGYEAYLKDLG